MQKKYYKAFIVCFAVVAITIVSLSFFSFALTEKNENAISSTLEKKNIQELFYEISNNDLKSDVLKDYVNTITKKLQSMNKKELSSIILSDKTDNEIKLNILTICAAKNIELDFDKLAVLLDDDRVSYAVKNVLIGLLTEKGEKYADSLTQAVLKNNGCTFQAMTSLVAVQPSMAEKIADDILSDLSGEFNESYKSAIATKATLLSLKSNPQELKKFIEICDWVINNMKTDDTEKKEVIVICQLSAVNKYETFKYLINSENETAKNYIGYIIDENKDVIVQMLNDKPTEESISIISKIYPYYYPQKEFKQMISNYLEKNSMFFNSNTELKNMMIEVTK